MTSKRSERMQNENEEWLFTKVFLLFELASLASDVTTPLKLAVASFSYHRCSSEVSPATTHLCTATVAFRSDVARPQVGSQGRELLVCLAEFRTHF